MTFSQEIFSAICDFLEGRDVFECNTNSTELPKSTNRFQLSCLGSGELKIQHELYFFLRCRFQQRLLVLPEYRGFKAKSDQTKVRQIDLMIFDTEMHPIVAIELKTHCANHGEIEGLLGDDRRGMKSDFQKRPVSQDGLVIPIIQIGLFPAIQKIIPMPQTTKMIRSHFRLFPLIANYVNANNIETATERVISAPNRFELWCRENFCSSIRQFYSFTNETSFIFKHPEQQYTIYGATHYCAFLAN